MKVDKIELDNQRREYSLRSMYFNRYLLIRYATAIFFVANLFWFVALMMLKSYFALAPAVLLVFAFGVMTEQMRLLNNHSSDLPFAIRYYWAQLIGNVVLIISTFTPLYTKFFPFMADSRDAKILLLIINCIGLLLSAFVLKRLYNIQLNKDSQYQQIQAYEKAMYL